MRKKGFTLVELIAVMAILSIISFVTYSIYFNGNRIYKAGNSQVMLQDTGRRALESISSSIKTAKAGTTCNVQLSGITFANGIKDKIQIPLILINPADNSNVYLYAIENNRELHKIFVGTNGADQLICNNIDYININPLYNQQSTFSIKVGALFDGEKVSYTTMASVGSMINNTNSITLSH